MNENNRQSSIENHQPKKVILIIDDEVELLQSLRRRLAAKYSVLTAESGDKGLNLLRANKKVDCILLDICMPRRSGIEILRDIRLSHPNMPVVIITGYGDEEIAIEALKSGAVGYMRKPLYLDALDDAINRAIETVFKKGILDLPAEILLVDDDLVLLKSLGDNLRKLHYNVRTASSGAEALDIMKKHRIDLLLVDIRMPKMNGIELMEHAAKIQTDFLPIVITGHGDYEIAIEAIKKAPSTTCANRWI